LGDDLHHAISEVEACRAGKFTSARQTVRQNERQQSIEAGKSIKKRPSTVSTAESLVEKVLGTLGFLKNLILLVPKGRLELPQAYAH
jgi:hypothetical protein